MPFDPLFDNDTVEPSAYVGGSDDYSERVDSLMTVIYNAILRIYNDDTVFISKFVLAQRIWMKYRDAELEAIMPAAPKGEYGEYEKQCRWQYRAALTKRRIEELLVWFNGQTHGSVCPETYMPPEFMHH